MYTQKDFQTVKEIIIKDVAAATSIILFGSYANGTARQNSDMDIAVLTEQSFNRDEKLKLLAVLRWDVAVKGYNADFILKNENDFLLERVIPTLSKVIYDQGIVLWKKN